MAAWDAQGVWPPASTRSASRAPSAAYASLDHLLRGEKRPFVDQNQVVEVSRTRTGRRFYLSVRAGFSGVRPSLAPFADGLADDGEQGGVAVILCDSVTWPVQAHSQRRAAVKNLTATESPKHSYIQKRVARPPRFRLHQPFGSERPYWSPRTIEETTHWGDQRLTGSTSIKTSILRYARFVAEGAGLWLLLAMPASALAAVEGTPCVPEGQLNPPITYGSLTICPIDSIGDADTFTFSGITGQTSLSLQPDRAAEFPVYSCTDPMEPWLELGAPAHQL